MLKKIPGSDEILMEYWSKTIKNYNLFGIEEVKEAIEELNVEDQDSILIRFWLNILSSNMRKRCPCESEVRRSIEEIKKNYRKAMKFSQGQVKLLNSISSQITTAIEANLLNLRHISSTR